MRGNVRSVLGNIKWNLPLQRKRSISKLGNEFFTIFVNKARPVSYSFIIFAQKECSVREGAQLAAVRQLGRERDERNSNEEHMVNILEESCARVERSVEGMGKQMTKMVRNSQLLKKEIAL